MKRFIIIIGLSLCHLLATGQEIRVEEVREIANDLEARTHPRQDLNGENCALLKIAAPSLEHLVFNGNIIGDTRYNAGVYYVYIPAGTKKIEYLHNDYLPGSIDFKSYGITIEKSTVYSIILLKSDLQQSSSRQFVIINVIPEDAIVELDGDMLNVSEGTAQKLVRFGTHHYRVSAPDLQSKEGDIIVNSITEKAIATVDLYPPRGIIEIGSHNNTSISGATVFLDGNIVEGQAPLKLENITAGKHTIRIVKQMYESIALDISVEGGKTLSINPTMKSNFAPVKVTAPAGCSISINGEITDKSIWESNIPAGSYIFETIMDGKVLSSKVVDIQASDTTQEIALTIPGGNLSIITSTPRADIILDGIAVGQTPLFLPNLSPGEHSLRLSKEGYETISKSIIINSGEDLDIDLSMMSSSIINNRGAESLSPGSKNDNTIEPLVNTISEKKKNTAFLIEANLTPAFFSSYDLFDVSLGARIGYTGKKFGGYLSIGSNFNRSYTTREGTLNISRKEFATGLLFNATKIMIVYGGLCYAERNLSVSTGYQNYTYGPVLRYGIGADLGVILKYGPIGLSAGVFINYCYVAPRLGLTFIL